METLYITTISIMIFVLCSLLIKKEKHNSDHILIVWLVLALMSEIGFYWLASGAYFEHLDFFRLFFGTQLLHAPILFFYILALFQKDFTFNWKNLIHLTPLVVFYLVHIPEFSKTAQLSACANHFGCFTCSKSCSIVYNLSKMIINTFYLALAFFAFKEHRLKMKNFVSISRTYWAGMLLVAGFMINGLIIFYRISEMADIRAVVAYLSFNHIHVFISVLIILFGFLIFNLDNIVKWILSLKKLFAGVSKEVIVHMLRYNSHSSIKDNLKMVTSDKNTAGLSEGKIEEYYSMIISYIEENKPYLDPHITKAKFAERLGIPQHHLSIVIKNRFNKTFNTFINTYRLSLVLERISKQEYKNYTLLFLAYECGFNSKSTFNRFFKSQIGMTPSQFLKMNPQDYNIRVA